MASLEPSGNVTMKLLAGARRAACDGLLAEDMGLMDFLLQRGHLNSKIPWLTLIKNCPNK